jgi:ketosteroid isomerase-like protein
MEASGTLHEALESRFIEGVAAFIRRDFEALGRTMHPDVVMHLPGSSWLAGTYRGPEEVGRCILGLRHVLESTEDRVSFAHEVDRMVVQHDIRLHGPLHDLEMRFAVAIGYDDDERIVSVDVEPADGGLFDHVLQTALVAFEASRFS